MKFNLGTNFGLGIIGKSHFINKGIREFIKAKLLIYLSIKPSYFVKMLN